MIVPVVSQTSVTALPSVSRFAVTYQRRIGNVRRSQTSPKIDVQSVIVGHDYGVARSAICVLTFGPIPTLAQGQIRKRLTMTNPGDSPPRMRIADENLAERERRDRIQ